MSAVRVLPPNARFVGCTCGWKGWGETYQAAWDLLNQHVHESHTTARGHGTVPQFADTRHRKQRRIPTAHR